MTVGSAPAAHRAIRSPIRGLELPRMRLPDAFEARRTVSVFHGTKYVVDGDISTPEGSVIGLRTVWIILASEEAPRFVTAYPISHPES